MFVGDLTEILLMSVTLRVTFDEYAQMVEDGAFDALRDRRIELFQGELREMNPPGPDHSEAVSRLNRWSVLTPPANQVNVRVQDPIGIPELDSAPQPDIAWTVPRSYADRHPLPHEVYLLIEVADSSVADDCGEKAALYATAGIQDYWVVNLPERLVHVFRGPTGGAYQQQFIARVGDETAPLKFPDVRLSVADLLAL